MMKAAGKVVRYSLILLVLVFALLVAAPFFIDANQYKSLIVDQAEKATGRHIEIGTLHASLFPWVGLTLEDVHIANPKGFAAGDLLQVKSLDVQVAVMPLLRGKYQIESFVLDSPRLHLKRAADGFTNWEDLLSGGQPVKSGKPEKSSGQPAVQAKSTASHAAPGAQPGGGALAALTARSLRMSDGEIHFLDATKDQVIDLTALNIDVDDVQMQRPVSLSVSGKLDGNAFSLDGMVGPLGDVTSLDVERLPVKGHLGVPGADIGKLAKFAAGLESLGRGTLGLDVQLEQRPNGVRVMAGSLKLHLLADSTDARAAGTETSAGVQAGSTATGVSAHDLALDVKAQMPDTRRMQIEQLVASLDGEQLADVNGTLTGIGGDMRYQLRVNTPELTRRQLARWLPELHSMYAAHPAPWKTVKLGMLAAGNASEVDIRDLQLLLNGELVQVSGNVNFASDPDIRLRIASRLLHVDPWLPQPAQVAGNRTASNQATNNQATNNQTASAPATQGGARIDHAASQGSAAGANPGASASDAANGPGRAVVPSAGEAVEPDLRFLKPWKIAAVIQVDRMWMRGLDMARLRADVAGKQGVIKLSPLRFELAGGRIEENASINAAAYPVRWSESVKVRDVQVQPLLVALARNEMLSGSLQMETRLTGRGLLPGEAMAGLNGSGSVLLRDGSIKGFDIAAMLRNLRSFGQHASGPQQTDFSQLSGSFNVKNGVARNDDLFVASPLFRLTGYGLVNLKDKAMDYHLKPRLVGTLVGQGDSEAVRKGLEVPLRLIGPLDKPQVKLEVSVESLLGNREAIREIVKDPKAALKNLLGGGLPGQPAAKPGSESAAPARIEPKSQPQQQPAQPVKPLDQLLKQVLPGL